MRVEVVERLALRFDEPFGEGPDRHVHVRAASSIVRFDGGFLLAQDDSNFAAFWRNGSIRPLRLFDGEHGDTYSSARGNKRHKPDLECGFGATVDGRRAAVFVGSGSTHRRHRGAVVFESTSEVRRFDAEPLHEAIREALGLPADLLNVEGAALVGDRLVLAQRGNGGVDGVNALVSMPWTAVEATLRGEAVAFEPEVARFDLGTLTGSRLGFTSLDVLPDGALLFAAAAEDSPNTYDDGACAGSVLGVIRGAHVVDTAPVGDAGDKVEGVVVTEVRDGAIDAWAVVDADDPDRPAEALRLRITV